MTHKSTTNIWWTFAITSLALFMVTLDNLVVTTALPVIRKDLHAGISGLEWTVNAYTLTFAVLLLTGAALGDRFGRRRLFAIGITIFTAASAAAALAPTIGALDAARAIQGLGGAIVMPLTLTILSAGVPEEKRGVFLGAWGGISGLAVAFGPLVGGAVVSGFSWHWVFWLNVPVGIALLALVPRLAETKGPFGRVDLPRPRARERRPVRDRVGARPRQLRGLGLPRDRRRARRRRRRDRAVRGVGAAHRASDAADAVLPQPHLRARERRVAPDELRDVRRDLPARAVLPDGAGLLAARLGPADPAVDGDADGRRADRRRAVRPHLGAAASSAPGSRCRRSASAGSRPSRRRRRRTLDLVLPFAISGIGMGMFFAPIANVILGSVRGEEEGQASGANNAIRELGGVFGVAVLASVFSHYGGYGSGGSFVDGMTPAVWIGAAVVGVGSLAAFAIRLKPKAATGRRARAGSGERRVASAP